MAKSPAAILYDESGLHPVAVVLDGSVYRLQSASKIARASDGTFVNPATQETLETRASESTLATRASEATLATRASEATLATRATEATLATRATEATLLTRATEATLLVADGRLATIDSVLDSIKDTDGIKKITDQLPAGTNEIGKVAQGTRALATGGWPEYIVDSAGNVVGVVLDGAVYRLQADAKVAKGSSALVHLDAIDTVTGKGRLKSTLYSADGDPVAFPSVSSSLRNDFVKYLGSDSLLVDGSVTPVEFTYPADATYDISIQEIKFTMVSNSITFGSSYFGATAGPLTNGVLVQVVANGVTIPLYTLKQNESFVNFASPGGFEWIVSSKDLLASGYLIGGGLKLHAGTSDKVTVTVRDDIDAAGVYFKCFVKGNLLSA